MSYVKSIYRCDNCKSEYVPGDLDSKLSFVLNDDHHPEPTMKIELDLCAPCSHVANQTLQKALPNFINYIK